MLRAVLSLAIAAIVLSGCSQSDDTDVPGPTPRELLFDISLPNHIRLSPAGEWVSFIQNYRGVPNIWLKPADESSPPRPLTTFSYPGVQRHVWHASSKYLLFLRQTSGADDVRPYVYDLKRQEVRSLLGNTGQQARFLTVSDRYPDSVYLLTNTRQSGQFDIYRADLETGASLLVHQDDLGANGYFSGPDLEPLIAQIPKRDGGFEWRMRTPDGAWRLWGRVAPLDALNTRITNVSRDGQRIYVASSIGRKTSAFLEFPTIGRFEPSAGRLLAAQDAYDFLDATYHPLLHTPLVAEFATPRPSWVPIDSAYTTKVLGMRASGSGQLRIVDAAKSVERWLIAHDNAAQPSTWGVFDAETAQKIVLFPQQDALMAQQAAIETLAVKIPVGDEMRDGFLTIPLGQTLDRSGKLDKPSPAVIDLRGPLASRDGWSYRPVHQWLASRGVAVLSLNHLGSTGQGKSHLLAGADAPVAADIAAAAAWLKRSGIASDKLGLVGSGLGARIGLAWAKEAETQPNCIALANPAIDLAPLTESLPDEMSGMIRLLQKLPGVTPGGAAMPAKATPIMIAQGVKNRRQPYSAALDWAKDAEAAGHMVTFLSVTRAAEQFYHGSDARAVMAVMEAFLAPCLGFDPEPLTYEDFKDAGVRLQMGSADLIAQVSKAKAVPKLTSR